MSLPMDFSTALWWRSVPVWEWQPLPPPPEDDATPPTTDCAPVAPSAAPPAAQPGSERDGYRLVLKGYQIAASLFWYPSDSPLSRPWLRHDEPAADRRPRADEAGDAAARAALLLEQQQRGADDSAGPQQRAADDGAGGST